MLRAVLFDMGGTLDGEGHWLDRFERLYRNAGINIKRQTLQTAFDHAERCAAEDKIMINAKLKEMVDRHLSWQFEYLELRDPALRPKLVKAFVEPVRLAASRNRLLLADLQRMGLQLGVVSNGCGNLPVLCTELGYSDYLSVQIDSRNAGVSKPDPAIYLLAAEKLGCVPAAVMMVGDSFERDIAPAKKVGMFTALVGVESNPPDISLLDLRLACLADLPFSLSTMAFNPA